MAAELVSAATSDKLTEVDWTKSIEICELVARDHRQAKDVIKAVKKRVGSKNANTQLFAVMLLEVLMNNIGEPIHKQVIDTGFLPSLVKLVKKKSDSPVREKIFLLLDATQTSLGGASGRFPQYYTAYYDLVSAGVQFPQRPPTRPNNHPPPNTNQNKLANGEHDSSGHERSAPQPEPMIVPESSIIQKAGNALEVLRDVLDAVDTKNPEGAKDEFTLDLVEQCSFQKQRVMHLAMTSRDEKVVSKAVELNDQLHKVLTRHDALMSARSTTSTTSIHLDQDEVDEEEEPEQLFRRIRKGKACVQPEDENHQIDRPLGLLGSSDRLHRPLIRPLSVEPKQEPNTFRPALSAVAIRSSPPMHVEQEPSSFRPAVPTVNIPPPPAKHVEREKFFQEKKSDGSALTGHLRGLSLHSRSASSSHSGSLDSSD